MPDEFEYYGEKIPYFDHMYNMTWMNERRVEVAIARRWMVGKGAEGIEVGNVMGHYDCHRHPVIDLHEPAAWYQELAGQPVINRDLFDMFEDTHAPWVISLSTIEHTEDPVVALAALCSMTNPGGQLLVTFPTGVDDRLDIFVEAGMPGFTRTCVMHRYGMTDEWLQAPKPIVRAYGPWANAIAVIEWEKP